MSTSVYARKSDTVVYNSKYIWIRRKVWLWQVAKYMADGWMADMNTPLIRPTMIYKMEAGLE